jgi:hypothetical protein
MDWWCGSSSRALALQVQSPEFKPSLIKKKKKVPKIIFSLGEIKANIFLILKTIFSLFT